MAEQATPRRESSKELERIVFFSDAIFAIAITLLVLDIRVPDIPEAQVATELPAQLVALWPKYLSYLISFLVISMYWIAHHSIFREIRDYDRRLVWLNFLFLMFIAFMPFPTSLLGEYGEHQLPVIIYAGTLAAARLLLAAIWWYATSNHRLVDPDLDPSFILRYRARGLAIPSIFLLSIIISFFSVNAALYSWFLLFAVDYAVRRLW